VLCRRELLRRRRSLRGQNRSLEPMRSFEVLCFQEVFWSHPPGSNRRPADYESAALPAELGWRSLDSNNLRATEKGWFRLCARNVLDTPGPSPSTRACAIKFTAIHPMLAIAP
jgi:hypothetical protein